MNKSKNQSGSAHVVLIVILVLIIVGLLGFVLWEKFIRPKDEVSTNTVSSSSTENNIAPRDIYDGWQTYTSQRAGFTIKYPATYKLIDTSDTPGNLVRLASPQSTMAQRSSVDKADYDVDISFEPTSGSMIASQLSAVAALKLSEKGNDFSQYASKKYTETVNGLSIAEFDLVGQTPNFAAVFKVGDNYVQISFPNTETKASLSRDLKAILESFKLK